MERFIIDRIEGDFAVLEREDGKIKAVPAVIIENSKEGDAVIFEDGKYIVDEEETKRRKKNIEEKMNRLFML